jgi:hypothetical protein
MRFWLFISLLVFATDAAADVSVTASVDRNHVSFGESLTFSLNLMGTQEAPKGSIPKVDGLTFEGPIGDQSINNNGQLSRTISFRATPASLGEFTIPAIEVEVGGKKYVTEPIKITVEKGAVQQDMQEQLFGKIQFDAKRLYLGQVAPLDVYVFARQDLPFRELSGYQAGSPEGLNYRNLPNAQSGARIIDGQAFNIFRIIGAVSPSKAGQLVFGPCVVKCQLAIQRRRAPSGSLLDDLLMNPFGTVEVREVPVTIDSIPIEVLPLPEQGRPADFAGAVGHWNLEVTAKPTELAVGDPITLTVKTSGEGNIDTVPVPKLENLDNFKTYDPTTKTTFDDLHTQGERNFQQVLIPKDANAKELPPVRLVFFDPTTEKYEAIVRGPIPLTVKAGGGTAVLATGTPARPAEKLGQDIVYLKGDLGPVAATAWFYSTTAFWVLNVLPVFSLAGLVVWKRRVDKLRGDVAYARRSRAAKNARKMLAEANSFDQIQRALQSYLGDRLNIPASGITASIVDEQLVPRGLNGDSVALLRACFEACDNARFAGVGNDETAMRATREKVKKLIDELEHQDV